MTQSNSINRLWLHTQTLRSVQYAFSRLIIIPNLRFMVICHKSDQRQPQHGKSCPNANARLALRYPTGALLCITNAPNLSYVYPCKMHFGKIADNGIANSEIRRLVQSLVCILTRRSTQHFALISNSLHNEFESMPNFTHSCYVKIQTTQQDNL